MQLALNPSFWRLAPEKRGGVPPKSPQIPPKFQDNSIFSCLSLVFAA